MPIPEPEPPPPVACRPPPRATAASAAEPAPSHIRRIRSSPPPPRHRTSAPHRGHPPAPPNRGQPLRPAAPAPSNRRLPVLRQSPPANPPPPDRDQSGLAERAGRLAAGEQDLPGRSPATRRRGPRRRAFHGEPGRSGHRFPAPVTSTGSTSPGRCGRALAARGAAAALPEPGWIKSRSRSRLQIRYALER